MSLQYDVFGIEFVKDTRFTSGVEFFENEYGVGVYLFNNDKHIIFPILTMDSKEGIVLDYEAKNIINDMLKLYNAKPIAFRYDPNNIKSIRNIGVIRRAYILARKLKIPIREFKEFA